MTNKNKVKIFERGEDVLSKKAQEVPVDEITSKKFQDIIEKMKQVVLERDDALAVAAPQIGESWRITIISELAIKPELEKQKNELKLMVFINPEITKISKDKKKYPEGCLSIPGKFGEVERAEKVKVSAYNEKGEKFSRGASGLLAQAIQHEIDHLDGKLFVEKAKNISDVNNE